MSDFIKRCEEKGIHLLPTPSPAGCYVPYVVTGNCIYISGQLPVDEDGKVGWTGAIDSNRVEHGYEAAARCGMMIVKVALSALEQIKKDESSIVRVVKLGGFVQVAADFYQVPQVVNGASELINYIFGSEVGAHSRFAVGVNTLPLNASVEVDAIIEIDRQ